MTLQRIYRSGVSGSQIHIPKSVLDKYKFKTGDQLFIDWEKIIYEAKQHRDAYPEYYSQNSGKKQRR